MKLRVYEIIEVSDDLMLRCNFAAFSIFMIDAIKFSFMLIHAHSQFK